MFASRLSIKWLKRASSKLNKPFCLPCKWRWVQLVALGGIEKQLGHRVQAIFGAFRLLLGGVNCAKHKRHEAPNSFMNLAETVRCTVSQQVRIKQLPLAKYEIYLTFSKSSSVQKFIILLFLHARGGQWPPLQNYIIYCKTVGANIVRP